MKKRGRIFLMIGLSWLVLSTATPLAHGASLGTGRTSRPMKALGFGPVNFQQLGTNDIGYGFSAAYAWSLDYAVLKLFGDFAFQGTAFWLNPGISASYHFLEGDVSPYVGLDFGFGFTKVSQGILSGETVFGFVLGGEVGVQMFRYSDVNLEIGLRTATLLNSNSLGRPGLLLLRVALLF